MKFRFLFCLIAMISTASIFAQSTCPEHIIGAPCDDGNDCTTHDVYNINCECVGTIQDSDEDGICDADEKKLSGLSVGGELVSRYFWRGITFSSSPAIQPTFSYSFQKDKFGLEVGTWGSYSFKGVEGAEVDLYLTLSAGPVSIGITDYFYPTDITSFDNYFDYDKSTTGHHYEGKITFDGIEKVPLTAMLAYNFYGSDKQNSLYTELAYTYKDDLTFAIGGGNGFYTREDNPLDDVFSISKIALTYTRKIKLSKHIVLPVSGTFGVNPNAGTVFLVLGIGLFEEKE